MYADDDKLYLVYLDDPKIHETTVGEFIKHADIKVYYVAEKEDDGFGILIVNAEGKIVNKPSCYWTLWGAKHEMYLAKIRSASSVLKCNWFFFLNHAMDEQRKINYKQIIQTQLSRIFEDSKYTIEVKNNYASITEKHGSSSILIDETDVINIVGNWKIDYMDTLIDVRTILRNRPKLNNFEDYYISDDNSDDCCIGDDPEDES